MASFPALKSGAVAQYGSDRERRFSTRVFRFVDGSEQRIAQHAAVLRRWTIRLELLDEAELETLTEFFEMQGGRAGSFAFTDPWDEVEYPDCSFDQDELVLEFRGEARGGAMVVVRENR
jgi:phage-related protein